MKNALLDVLKSRLIWYAVLGCLLFCLGIYFYTQWDLARFSVSHPKVPQRLTSDTTAETEADIANETETETQAGHWHGEQWHAEPHAAPSPTTETAPVAAEHTDNSFPVPWLNPLMPDEIPEHLKMPPEWVNWNYMTITEESHPTLYADLHNRLLVLRDTVIENYNPKRPIEEVWPAFIEAEKLYLANSEHAQKHSVRIVSAFRADFFYQGFWNFPEIHEMIRAEGGLRGQWYDVFRVEMGEYGPNWNRFHLQDGREFRVRDDKRYEFHIGYDEETGAYAGSYSYSFANPDTAETIHVYPETMSDAELEALQGWNYNFNPYTGKPISR